MESTALIQMLYAAKIDRVLVPLSISLWWDEEAQCRCPQRWFLTQQAWSIGLVMSGDGSLQLGSWWRSAVPWR